MTAPLPLYELKVSWRMEAIVEMSGRSFDAAAEAAWEAATEGHLPGDAVVADGSFVVEGGGRIK